VRPDDEEEGLWCASSPSMASAVVVGWSGWWCLVLGLGAGAVVRAQTGRSDEVGPCVIERRGAPSRRGLVADSLVGIRWRGEFFFF
jgi:hypothetical protein